VRGKLALARESRDRSQGATRLHMHFLVRGKGAESQALWRMPDGLSHEKYCSASIMLGKTARYTEDFEILRADQRPEFGETNP